MRKRRELEAGASYHISARINRQEFLFKPDYIKEMFMEVLRRAKGKYRFLIRNFCIMDNYRKMKSGLVVWYNQTYDNNNRRTTARSTGQTSKGAARVYCNKLYKMDALVPNRGGNLVFARYAENWWIWDKCEYVKFRLSRRELSRNYVSSGRTNLKKHILPYFGRMRLDAISSYDIEKWLLTFAEKGLSNLTANMNLTFLNIMLTDAIRRGLMTNNPADNILPLKKDTGTRDILTTT